MKILVVASVEDKANVLKQIEKQTLQPDYVFIYLDKHPVNGINERRKRIAENHKVLQEAVREIECDLVWQIEGDSEVPEDGLECLVEHYKNLNDETFGYVSGVQVGRHGIYCLGAWTYFDEDHFESINPYLHGIQEVEATGFYCLLASKKVWLSGKCEWNGEAWGCDVNWGRSIHKRKYVDMNLEIGHITKYRTLMPSDKNVCQVYFFKVNDQWQFKCDTI